VTRRTLEPDDVVFMYAAKDLSAYPAYGATFLAWGGAHTSDSVKELLEIGVHPTASMWCLTAKPRLLHENADLRDATVRDVSGGRVAVPWLFDHVHEGTPAWFGCTNHPAFRAHVRAEVARAMAGGAHGLHVDDHRGTATPAIMAGGCFCVHCMAGFRGHLVESSDPELLAEAEVASFEGLDYRELVMKHARTREEYIEVQEELPLHREYVDWQLVRAAENLRDLGRLAEGIVERPITLSVNACLPELEHLVPVPYVTHIVGEVPHSAEDGTRNLLDAVRAYRMAEAVARPIASTAHGWDWDFVRRTNCETLVRVWIALSYACGQRLMTPHRAWCFNKDTGTDYYHGPTEAYAPLYRFVRERRSLFRDKRTVGPLSPPSDVPARFDTRAERQRLREALDRGDPRPIEAAGGRVWVFPRAGAAKGSADVVHLLNLDYDAASDSVAPQRGFEIELPDSLFGRPFEGGLLHSYDAESVALSASRMKKGTAFRMPELRLWSVLELK
jgi:hypothetical protein